MASAAAITKHWPLDPDENPWVAGHPPPPSPIEIAEPDPTWPARYEELAARIRGALGDRVVALDHVGSTSVPGLPAKPIIDIDLTVADSRDEAAYVPALEAAGFELLIREPGWHEHRCFAATVPPRCNLHVWSPDCPEAIRHQLLRDWLREHPATGSATPPRSGRRPPRRTPTASSMMAYNARKEPVLREILDRVFRAHGLA